MALHIKVPSEILLISYIIVDPVVVKAEAVSNKQFINERLDEDKTIGIEDKIGIVIHTDKTIKIFSFIFSETFS